MIELGCLLIRESTINHISNSKFIIIFNIIRFRFIIIIAPLLNSFLDYMVARILIQVGL